MPGKVFEGVVSSSKMEKTIVVSVRRKFPEKRTGKIISRGKKYKVHCVDSEIGEGDTVTFTECAPYSKDKKFRFLKVVRKAVKAEG